MVNVLAVIRGTDSTGAIALVAHYDTDPPTPGANDNSAGVAVLLETGRALREGPALRNDVILLFTDGEAPAPKYGTSAFFGENAWAGDLGLVVNLEALGASGPSMLVETSGPEPWMVEQYDEAVSDPTAFSFVAEVMSLLGDIGTDFDLFRNAGVPGFHFAYMRDSPVYHTAADDMESVSWDSVQHHGSNALGIVRHFGSLDLRARPEARDSVYFTLRPFFVQYEAARAQVLALLVALLFAGTLAMRARAGRRPRGSLIRAGGVAVLPTLAATLAATLAWIFIASLRTTPSVPESYVWLLCVLGVGAAAGVGVRALAGGRHRPDESGWLPIWVVLTLLTAYAAPGFSYLFAWPALATVLVAR